MNRERTDLNRVFGEIANWFQPLMSRGEEPMTDDIVDALCELFNRHTKCQTLDQFANVIRASKDIFLDRKAQEGLSLCWEFLNRRIEFLAARNLDYKSDQHLVNALEQLLDREFGVQSAFANITTLDKSDAHFRVTFDVKGNEGEGEGDEAPRKNQPLRVKVWIDPDSSDETWTICVMAREPNTPWGLLFPNLFEPYQSVTPGVDFWIPDVVSHYQILTPDGPFEVKLIATPEPVSIPCYVPRTHRQQNCLRKQEQYRTDRREAFEELYAIGTKCPGRIVTAHQQLLPR